MTSDFTDIATTTTVRKCLGRQVEEKNIRRIMDGLYEKPVYSKLLKEYISANPDAIAYAIARSFRWTIAPYGEDKVYIVYVFGRERLIIVEKNFLHRFFMNKCYY